MKTKGILSSLLACLISTFSCAGDVGDIDRSQPGKIKKSVFEGEWYFRQTVTDVPFGTGVTFIGEQSALERVRWDISEEFLTAYRSYEWVENSEKPSHLKGQAYEGAPIAVFRIVSHFDVARDYNPATGEQTNIIVENSYDRPWFERKFIRVDWSSNLVANFSFIASSESGLGVRSQAASYAITDPSNPDAPVFGLKTEKGWEDFRAPDQWGKLDSADYFDIVQKLVVTPDTFPIYYEDDTYEEVPACWYYEYGPWDCASQTVKIRASFLKRDKRDYEALSFPDNYLARDENSDVIRVKFDSAQDQVVRCEAGERQDCTTVRIPMFDQFGYFRRERESYDPNYGLTESGRQYWIDRFNLWERSTDENGETIPYANRQVKPIIYYLSENFPKELESAAIDIGKWWNEAFTETVTELQGKAPNIPVFEVRPNHYAAQDGQIQNFGERNGDLRYNHLYWVADPQLESLLGYGPSAADPRTGEIISADAYVYGAAINEWATWATDLIELLQGKIPEDAYIEGENVQDIIHQLTNAQPQSADYHREGVSRLMKNGLGEKLSSIKQRGKRAYRARGNHTLSRLKKATEHGLGPSLWNDEMQLALEQRFGRRLEPHEFGAGRLSRAMRKHRIGLAKKRLDFAKFEDMSVLPLVKEFQGKSREDMILAIRTYLFKATGAHEIGHTIGLRHNFAGSVDALNYHDAYWQIRANDAEALQLPSKEEVEQGLREFSYASIMDYGARFNSDIRGLGKYDRAAVKFGYGQLVEVFETAPDPANYDLLYYYDLKDIISDYSHYTDLRAIFSSTPGANDGHRQFKKRVNLPYQNVIDWMTASQQAEDLTDRVVPYRFCSDEYVDAQWDCMLWDEGADPFEMVNHAAQMHRDHYIIRSFKRDKRYLDPYEVYDSVYWRTLQPMASLYHLWLYDQWEKTYEWSSFQDIGLESIENADWNLDPHGGLTGAAAAKTALQFMGEIIATPEPGSYYTDPDTDMLTWWSYDEDRICQPREDSSTDDCSDIYVPLGQGRYAYTEFDADSGYYWYERARVIGAFWEKLAAIETLADPTTYFLGVDDTADYTSYNLGFNAAFPNEVYRLFGSVINDDYSNFAFGLNDSGQLIKPDLFTPETRAQNALQKIDPATNFTVSLYTLFYGMALFNSNFDQSFNDHAKIWIAGNGEAIDPVNPDTSTPAFTEFVNPFNQRRYRSIPSPDEKHYSMGTEMLKRANSFSEIIANAGDNCFLETTGNCQEVQWVIYELQNLIENIEVARGYYDIFGYAYF